MVLVIDASVAVKWFVREEGRDAALEILASLLKDPRKYAAPELFFFEVMHVFHRLIPDPSEEQKNLLLGLTSFGLERVFMTPELGETIREFQSLGLSGYDGAYAAVAKHAKGKWLTFDEEAHAKISSLGVSEFLGR